MQPAPRTCKDPPACDNARPRPCRTCSPTHPPCPWPFQWPWREPAATYFIRVKQQCRMRIPAHFLVMQCYTLFSATSTLIRVYVCIGPAGHSVTRVWGYTSRSIAPLRLPKAMAEPCDGRRVEPRTSAMRTLYTDSMSQHPVHMASPTWS